jgi:hypothetical protein
LARTFWTPEEDNRLRMLLGAGRPIEIVAAELKRSAKAKETPLGRAEEVTNMDDEDLKLIGAQGEARQDIVSMTGKRRKHRWSFAEDRRLLELAANARSSEEIANLMSRPPETIHRVAIRLGISLRNDRRRSTSSKRPRVMRIFMSAGTEAKEN